MAGASRVFDTADKSVTRVNIEISVEIHDRIQLHASKLDICSERFIQVLLETYEKQQKEKQDNLDIDSEENNQDNNTEDLPEIKSETLEDEKSDSASSHDTYRSTRNRRKRTHPRQSIRHGKSRKSARITQLHEGSDTEIDDVEDEIKEENIEDEEESESDDEYEMIDGQTKRSKTKKYKCAFCNFSTHWKSSLLTHESTHDKAKTFQCKQCKFKAISKYELRKHKATHLEPSNMFLCQICGKSFLLKSFLTQHHKIHTDERPFKCKLCPAAFKNGPTLENHERSMHDVGEAIECPECGKAFKTRSALCKHKRNEHATPEQREKGKKFTCSICSYRGRSAMDLENHSRKHTGDKCFHCDKCDFRTAWKKNLIDHQQKHTGAKNYKCKLCDFSSTSRYALKKHSLGHSKEHGVICELCGDIYPRKSDLKAHKKHKHDIGAKMYTCTVCGFSTSYKMSFENHTKRGCNSSVNCEFCGLVFQSKKVLAAHHATDHPGLRKVYKCPHCDFVGPNRQALYFHRQKSESCAQKNEQNITRNDRQQDIPNIEYMFIQEQHQANSLQLEADKGEQYALYPHDGGTNQHELQYMNVHAPDLNMTDPRTLLSLVQKSNQLLK